MMRIVLIIIIQFLAVSGFAQTIGVGSQVSKDSMRIGEQIAFQVAIQGHYLDGIQWPQFDKTIGPFEIIELRDIDTLQHDTLTLVQTVVLTIFDEGSFEIPSVAVVYGQDSILTEVHQVTVWGEVIDSTNNRLIDVGPPIKVPHTWREWAPIVLGLIGLLLLIALVIYLIRRWMASRMVTEQKKPDIPAHIIAFGELAELKNQGLIDSEMLLPYYTKLSQILRRYMENRYDFPALESTKKEIINDLRKIAEVKDHIPKLSEFLTLSDLIKFAKAAPDLEDHQAHFEMIYDFVTATKQEEKVTEDE